MSQKEIRLGGFGGQGIVLAGVVLGKAAAIYDHKHATLTQSYGPESRGGAAKAEVVISDEAIDYPRVLRPDVSMVMSQEAYTNYTNDVKEEGCILVEEDLVELHGGTPKATLLSIPATRIAEELGNRIVVNMVMLGFLTAVTGVASEEAMRQSIRNSVPRGTIDLNLKAFEAGMRYGAEVLAAAGRGEPAP